MKVEKALAVILARGGSKRIPKKNIRPFLGEPVITFPIRAALKSGCFDEVMVSTDDDAIAGIAREAGAVVPFKRSAEASGDDATTVDVVREVMAWYENGGRRFETLCAVYAVTPLMTADHLCKGYDLLLAHPEAGTVMPVVRFGYPVQRAFKIEDGALKLMNPEHEFTRSQDLCAAYHDAGQWYWLRAHAFAQERKIFMKRCVPLILSEMECQDIDHLVDWQMAEVKARMQEQAL